MKNLILGLSLVLAVLSPAYARNMSQANNLSNIDEQITASELTGQLMNEIPILEQMKKEFMEQGEKFVYLERQLIDKDLNKTATFEDLEKSNPELVTLLNMTSSFTPENSPELRKTLPTLPEILQMEFMKLLQIEQKMLRQMAVVDKLTQALDKKNKAGGYK